MLMPAQHLPISLIGSMWNLCSRWSSPEEEGYVEEKCVEVRCNISVTLGSVHDWKHTYKCKDIHAKMMLYDPHMQWGFADTHAHHTNQRPLGTVIGTCSDNTEGKQTHCALYFAFVNQCNC